MQEGTLTKGATYIRQDRHLNFMGWGERIVAMVNVVKIVGYGKEGDSEKVLVIGTNELTNELSISLQFDSEGVLGVSAKGRFWEN